MFLIFFISIFLLCTTIVSQYTESSVQFPKMFINHYNSIPSNFDPLIMAKHTMDPSDKKADSTRVLLFDRTKKKWVYLDKPHSMDKWNKNGELKVIIHGFNPLTQLSGIPALRAHNVLVLGREYVRRNSSVNVVIVDWMPMATRPLNQYSQAVDNTRSVGMHLTDKLMRWKDQGNIKKWKGVHIIGFSLGGHMAGIMGYQILARTGQKIGRITGLDPAGPGFSDDGKWPEDRTEFLDYTDARFVDIVHCNMGMGGANVAASQGTFGSVVKAGHVDFYPNGGVRQKYNCDKYQDILGCSHLYCVKLMAAGVRNVWQFPMCPCSSWDTFLSGSCDCENEDSSEAICVGDEAIRDGGPKFYGYYGVVTTKLNPDYFRSLLEDDIELV